MSTPWQAGAFKGGAPRLLFGRMYEDSAIELRAIAPNSRVFSIASAGCTARALAAAGHKVTAVDINPEQVAYAQSRATGGPLLEGAADRVISRGRSLLGLAGWSDRKVEAFLELDDPAEQIEYWDRKLDSILWRAGIDAVLSPWLLRLIYSGPFVRAIGRGLGERIRVRLRRCWATHSNRTNPYLQGMFSAGSFLDKREEPLAPVHPIHFARADAATFLENCSPTSFDAFSLSNIVDGASAEYARRLTAAMSRAAAPGAIAVIRSFAEPRHASEYNWAAHDRSFLWGSVDVRRLGGS